MDRDRVPPDSGTQPKMAKVVDRNIRALLAHRRREEGDRSLGQRIADWVTRLTGSLPFVSIHLLILALWVLVNLGWLPHFTRFDPSFTILASVASVEALFLATFVLIAQKRMAAMADKRAELDLQVSLLAEHEITQLLTLVTEIAKRMGLETAQNPELAELAQDVEPEKVMDKMEAHKRATGTQPKG